MKLQLGVIFAKMAPYVVSDLCHYLTRHLLPTCKVTETTHISGQTVLNCRQLGRDVELNTLLHLVPRIVSRTEL